MDSADQVPKVFKLNNGVMMPTVGLGTAEHFDEASMVAAIMEAGYLAVDTASQYENEGVLGAALQKCFAQGKKREDLFIATKIWHQEYHDVEAAVRGSLKKMQLDYLDLYYIHWPLGYFTEGARTPVHVLWPQMEALVEKGLVKSIGVSNFNTQMLLDLLCYCKIKPAVNQIELNPLCAQYDLVDFCHSHDVRPVAFTPLCRPGVVAKGHRRAPKDWPDLRDVPCLQEIAKNHGKSVI